MIQSLVKADIGKWVVYTGGAGEQEAGRIKSSDNKNQRAWVVYACAGEWDNYQDYTGAATQYGDLEFDPSEGEQRND